MAIIGFVLSLIGGVMWGRKHRKRNEAMYQEVPEEVTEVRKSRVLQRRLSTEDEHRWIDVTAIDEKEVCTEVYNRWRKRYNEAWQFRTVLRRVEETVENFDDGGGVTE